MKAIIPTGGRGTRMQPLTFSANKHFIPVANQPLIFYPIATVASAGIKDIGITYNPGWLPKVQGILGDGSRWGVKFTYILQEEPKGLANIVEVSENYLAGDSFVFHLGDNIFADGIKDIVNYFQKEKPNGLVTMMHHPENKRMGVPYFDKKGRLQKYIEKPSHPPHDFAVPGLYFGDSNFFKAFAGKDAIKASKRGEYEIPSPYQWLIDHKFRVDVVEYKGKWLDPGKFDDWFEANRYLLDRFLETKIDSKVNIDTTIEGRVTIGRKCKILNSQIRGPVAISDNVQIKDSFIGPFTSISRDCEILESHIENSILMNGVKIASVNQPIDTSLIGAQSIIAKGHGPTEPLKFLVGDKSQIQL